MFDNIVKDMVYRAQYEVKTFKVEWYNEDKTSILKTETVEYGGTAVPPASPDKAGYTFTGWSESYTDIKKDIEIVPVYTVNKYTVRFLNYDNSELKTQTVSYGGSAIPPSVPTRKWYINNGWDKSYANITSDTDIQVVWVAETANPITVYSGVVDSLPISGQVDLESNYITKGKIVTTSAKFSPVGDSVKVSDAYLTKTLKTYHTCNGLYTKVFYVKCDGVAFNDYEVSATNGWTVENYSTSNMFELDAPDNNDSSSCEVTVRYKNQTKTFKVTRDSGKAYVVWNRSGAGAGVGGVYPDGTLDITNGIAAMIYTVWQSSYSHNYDTDTMTYTYCIDAIQGSNITRTTASSITGYPITDYIKDVKINNKSLATCSVDEMNPVDLAYSLKYSNDSWKDGNGCTMTVKTATSEFSGRLN